MFSFSNAVSFAFNKRNFIIGIGLLVLTSVFMLTLGYILSKLGPEYIIALQNMSEKTKHNIGYFLYAIKTLFFSVLFTYLFILAKQLVYKQPGRFSSEFFYRVLLTVFGFKVITDLAVYAFLTSTFMKNWTAQKIMTLVFTPTAWEITKLITICVVAVLLFYFCIVALYMAYIMHFNFTNFLYKLKHTFTSPITFLKIIGFFLLFVLLSLIPIAILCLFCGGFSSDAVIEKFLPCLMGACFSFALFFYSILVGIPFVFCCVKTVSGRIFGIYVTASYLILYSILRFKGMPSLPFLATLYLYVFFVLLNLFYIFTTVIYPAFWIHLVAQGTLEVHQKFDPSVHIPQKNEILPESEQKTQTSDGEQVATLPTNEQEQTAPENLNTP